MDVDLYNVFEFLENKKGKRIPFKFKWMREFQLEPEDLMVGGNLDFSHYNIDSLPDNLTVDGSLDVSYTSLNDIPNNLVIGDALYLSNTPIYDKLKEIAFKKGKSTVTVIANYIKSKGGSINGGVYQT